MECVFCKSIQQECKLHLPIKQGKLAPVSMHDVVHGWMKLMEMYQKHSFDELPQSHKHSIMCYTGPKLICGPKLAGEVSAVLSTKLCFQHVSEDELCRHLKQPGELSREEIEGFVKVMYNIREGHLEEQTKDLEKLVGNKPMHLHNFLEHHKDKPKPLQ
ncbi:hypothetical protein IWQ60_011111 [Tieghemiomyces parasiticus]|uniref:Uncharacterized protein n=1 Tax=Tieghemiomyces parasiticus TaxID=78921 RepID=A0A9W8DLW5_9FUNG|nr:hypothetical protein IWQ60_011111 [Tieghemiomyces parasiticus]